MTRMLMYVSETQCELVDAFYIRHSLPFDGMNSSGPFHEPNIVLHLKETADL